MKRDIEDLFKKFDEELAKPKFPKDPTLDFEHDMTEIITLLKVKLTSYMDNDYVSTNLYQFMKTYLSDYVIDEVMSCCLDKKHKRNVLLNTLIKNDNE